MQGELASICVGAVPTGDTMLGAKPETGAADAAVVRKSAAKKASAGITSPVRIDMEEVYPVNVATIPLLKGSWG